MTVHYRKQGARRDGPVDGAVGGVPAALLTALAPVVVAGAAPLQDLFHVKQLRSRTAGGAV
jgi:hypothetical protein